MTDGEEWVKPAAGGWLWPAEELIGGLDFTSDTGQAEVTPTSY